MVVSMSITVKSYVHYFFKNPAYVDVPYFYNYHGNGSMNKKTLCIFSPAFPNDDEPSWLTPVQVLITALNNAFPELKIVIFSFQYPPASDTYLWHGNQVIPFNMAGKSKLSKPFTWMKIFYTFYRIKRKEPVLGILSFWCSECTFIAAYCQKLLNIRYYCWLFGQDAKKGNKYVKRVKPKEGSLIALSDFLQEEFHRNYGIKPRYVIPKGIEPEFFDKEPVTRDIDILCTGSLIALKRYDIAIEVIDALVKHFPELKAELCGEGVQKINLTNLVIEKGLKANILLHGLVPHRKTLKLMRKAKILLHPSSYEGFGFACLEALYAGAHVISFCKPMKQDIPQWHIVKTKEEMLATALAILSDKTTTYESVLPYTGHETAMAVMQLFDYPTANKT